jgi:hypothetical protein
MSISFCNKRFDWLFNLHLTGEKMADSMELPPTQIINIKVSNLYGYHYHAL